jgi:hypothetical protein
MCVSYGIEQALIQSRSVENNFSIVRRADGTQGDGELSRVLNVDCDLIATSQAHIAHRAARIAALFQINLRSDLYILFLLHNIILVFALADQESSRRISIAAMQRGNQWKDGGQFRNARQIVLSGSYLSNATFVPLESQKKPPAEMVISRTQPDRLCRINDIALDGLLRRQDIDAWVVR